MGPPDGTSEVIFEKIIQDYDTESQRLIVTSTVASHFSILICYWWLLYFDAGRLCTDKQSVIVFFFVCTQIIAL